VGGTHSNTTRRRAQVMVPASKSDPNQAMGKYLV